MKQAGSRRVTIYDLAKLAGSSPSAVSAILNGTWKKRRISEALAARISRIAEEQGYFVNMQASALRREGSHMIGMIVPKYDNRYFGSIVEMFESMARARGLFPVITCTQRDPDLEIEAARALISHQVDCLIATGATNADRISALCETSGVRTFNLDLPGSLAASVISDNYGGARALTRRLLSDLGAETPQLLFVGGRAGDHNTNERIRGFCDAMHEAGISPLPQSILACGYEAGEVRAALDSWRQLGADMPQALFVNSTIALEGVMTWLPEPGTGTGRGIGTGRDIGTGPRIGCFDWDPIVAALRRDVLMVRQDVPAMLSQLFRLIDGVETEKRRFEIPTVIEAAA